MKRRLLEHGLSIVLIAIIFIAVAAYIVGEEESLRNDRAAAADPYLNMDSFDYAQPLHKQLMVETLQLYYPDARARNDSLMKALEDYRIDKLTLRTYKTGGDERGISIEKLSTLFGMYLKFILIFVVVMALSYYAAQTLAVYRFVKWKQHHSSFLQELIGFISSRHPGHSLNERLDYAKHVFIMFSLMICKGISLLIFFAPAYVIAYSFKTRFDTDSVWFMAVLGVISNGLLMYSSNRFFLFLVAESRKGYVQTAIVKNLHTSYKPTGSDGISYRSMFALRKRFPSHVFHHIYINARYQYIAAMKEHASFLVTGLVIIEMALNIQGFFCYEMLQNILYRQYDVVLTIIFGIFLIVKATEIVIDLWYDLETKKYENTTGTE
jgi:hypothetical protein